MKVIHIPIKSDKIVKINLLGILFIYLSESKLFKYQINAELIKSAQIKELGFVLYYLWIPIEFLIKLMISGFKFNKAISEISLNKEVELNKRDYRYLSRKNNKRSRYSFLKYL